VNFSQAMVQPTTGHQTWLGNPWKSSNQMGIAMGKSWKIIRPNGSFFPANHGNEFSMESISNEVFHGIYI